MEDLEAKIKSLLSSPEGMDQLLSVAKAIAGGGNSEAEGENSTVERGNSGPSTGLPLDGIDPKLISIAMQLMSEYTGSTDRRIGLLHALRPYLKNDEQGRIDKAIQIVKLSKVAKTAFNSFTEGE